MFEIRIWKINSQSIIQFVAHLATCGMFLSKHIMQEYHQCTDASESPRSRRTRVENCRFLLRRLRLSLLTSQTTGGPPFTLTEAASITAVSKHFVTLASLSFVGIQQIQ